jgi:peptide/nickel transport system substrate-binding protein
MSFCVNNFRSKFFTIISLLIALTFSGCNSGDGRKAEKNNELVVGAGADVSVTGAFQAQLGVYPLNVNVAEPLVRLTPDYKVEPLLATRWEFLGNNTWRFYLRQGIKFHDGQEFNAKAVQWSVLRHIKKNIGYSFITENSLKIVDDYTIDITPSQTNYPLPQQLVHPNYSIFAPNTDPSVKPVGTGAFRWVEYQPNERVVVERNDDYWGEKALLERITFRFYPDPTSRVLALQAGETDLIMDLPREQSAQIAQQSNLTVARSKVGLMMSLSLNVHGNEPYQNLKDINLRKAVAHSLDRQTLVKTIWEGEGETVQNMTVPEILGEFAGKVEGFSFDLQKSAQLLDAAGWQTGENKIRVKQGKPLKLVLLANPEVESGTVEFLQANMRQSGIDAQWIKLPDIGSYQSRLNAGQYDMNISMANQNDGNPLFLPTLIFYSKSARPFAKWQFVGEKFDRFVEEGLQTDDADKVRLLAAEAIRVAVDEETVTIPVAGLFRLYAMKKNVTGFMPHPSQTNQDWTKVSKQ